MTELKKLIGGMTFSNFLIAESAMPQMDVKTYIKSLPSYQELKSSDETRGPAVKLAGELARTYANTPIDQDLADEIFDAFDDLTREAFPHGAALADWEGLEQKRKDEIAAAKAQDAAMDAELEPIKRKRLGRGATFQQGAYDKAKADFDKQRAQMAQNFNDKDSGEQAASLSAAKAQQSAPKRKQRSSDGSTKQTVLNIIADNPGLSKKLIRQKIMQATGASSVWAGRLHRAAMKEQQG